MDIEEFIEDLVIFIIGKNPKDMRVFKSDKDNNLTEIINEVELILE